jgi:hypothetical protein
MLLAGLFPAPALGERASAASRVASWPCTARLMSPAPPEHTRRTSKVLRWKARKKHSGVGYEHAAIETFHAVTSSSISTLTPLGMSFAMGPRARSAHSHLFTSLFLTVPDIVHSTAIHCQRLCRNPA